MPGGAAEHVLIVHSHSLFLDIQITSALIRHHLHKNHDMRVTVCELLGVDFCSRSNVERSAEHSLGTTDAGQERSG